MPPQHLRPTTPQFYNKGPTSRVPVSGSCCQLLQVSLDRLLETQQQSVADQGMANRYLGQGAYCAEQGQVCLIEIVPRIQSQPKFDTQLGCTCVALKLMAGGIAVLTRLAKASA